MKLQFDKNQNYQLEAIQSIVSLFEGQPLNKSGFELPTTDNDIGSIQSSETCISNNLMLSEEALLENLQKVQAFNNLRSDEVSTALEKLSYTDSAETKGDTLKVVATNFPNYSVEMETGTGKTYVYLRSIYELSKVYGFKKFVIVVPSVAIREGVLKTLQITTSHFNEIYENQPSEYKIYDPSRLTELANFAKSNAIQILVINIDSFTKDANIINQIRESGIKPIELIQQANPIVIIDEPQNIETDIRKKAIANLNPLFVLRFSATHKNLYNLVYKLDPVKAYDLGLVKQIEVDSVVVKNDHSSAFISLDTLRATKDSVIAKVTLFVSKGLEVEKRQVIAKAGDDLYNLSKGCDLYKHGFVITEIDVDYSLITLSNGRIINKGEAVGGLTDHILKEMVDATVENHFKKEKELRAKDIKVLSIFFVDRVANYRTYDTEGKPMKGKFAQWFEDSFARWLNKPDYQGLFLSNPNDYHNGYFSQDKGKLKDSKEGKPTKADDEVFKLIMRDKERLLDMSTPLRFIFSHSALREGWDNPNVFQICTLNETKSDIKKRQEIGRGLRLCVDQSGVRNFDRAVNRLTVIANEAYDSFSKKLQREIEEDCGVRFENRIKNARERVKVQLKDKWFEDQSFLALWDRIKHCTEYSVNFTSEQLINNCVKALELMPEIDEPVIYKEKNVAQFRRDTKGQLIELKGEQQNAEEITVEGVSFEIPDLVSYLQTNIALTRNTIIEILLRSNRLADIFHNPQSFTEQVVRLTKQELNRLKITGISYVRAKEKEHQVELFQTAEVDQYRDNLVQVSNQSKTLYNFIDVERSSKRERKFADDCELRDDIEFYIKLPKSFTIQTPIGAYTPDWALIKTERNQEKKAYYVVAIKESKAIADSEKIKIECAQKHFAALNDVHFRVVESVSDLKI